MGVFEKIFGTYSSRELKRVMPIVRKIEELEPRYRSYSDAQLREMTDDFRSRLKAGQTLDDILPEAFAVVREMADRALGKRPFEVQLIGGVILHQGRIAEMKTGEGKTLAATMPVYLNALTGEGVHVVTVNDYLARRDSEEMGRIYNFLGLTVGLCIPGMTRTDKRAAYACDITYGTNNEFGFDYLRDNMVTRKEHMVQRGHVFAVVDEVDSILIDEARTPLIISGQGEESTDMYERADRLVKSMKREVVLEQDAKKPIEDYDADYVVDEKAKTVVLTPSGIQKAERFFKIDNLSDAENSEIYHHINQAMKAHGTMRRDVDYVVRPDGIVIVDEFTGRLMFGRRYSNGLHQAIEAKEGVEVKKENKTLATITFQNYFRLYKKLSGMTGTALTEEQEFQQIYGMDVVEIPTNMPMIRIDHPDVVYKTVNAKYNAIIEQILECHERKQPVLVGTVSIEKSEILGKMLKKYKVPFNILNAKYHEREAEIVAQAGRLGNITIATNMAGRGTDIKLGGNPEYLAKQEMKEMGIAEQLVAEADSLTDTQDEEILNIRRLYRQLHDKYKEQTQAEAEEVIAAGGLFILGTERHESRRIDNQLRGRSGRQGDIGHSRFYLSLEDDLMRLFGGERMSALLNTLRVDEDMPIEHHLLTNMIESAQKRVENANFESRKRLLEYDDVINKQRETIYAQRQTVLDGEDVADNIRSMIGGVIHDSVERYTAGHAEEWNLDALRQDFQGVFLTENDLRYTDEQMKELTREKLIGFLTERAFDVYKKKEELYGSEIMREMERVVLLYSVDTHWMAQIDAMDDLKQGMGLRSYAQENPIVAYRKEGMEMYAEMIDDIRFETVRMAFLAKPVQETLERRAAGKITGESHGEQTAKKNVTVRKAQKVGRNDPCPCGSGKKYKKCCGQNE